MFQSCQPLQLYKTDVSEVRNELFHLGEKSFANNPKSWIAE